MSQLPRVNKEEFIQKMKDRTKKFAIDVIHFCDTLPPTQACRTISFQLIKAATSTGQITGQHAVVGRKLSFC